MVALFGAMNKTTLAGLIAAALLWPALAGCSRDHSRPAAGETVLSSPGLTLEIYGNANLDDTVDDRDAEYVTDIIGGRAAATPFADADLDGSVDARDIDQIRAIMAGTVTRLHLLDGNGRVLTVRRPVARIVLEYVQNAEIVRILGVEDRVAGVDYGVDKLKPFYFPEQAARIASVGSMQAPDYEAVLDLHPDILLTFMKDTAEKAAKLPGVDVVYLGLYEPRLTDPGRSSFVQGILKAGYIFGRVSRAREYVDWLLGLAKRLNERTRTLTGARKKTVLMTNYPYAASSAVKAYAAGDTLGQMCELAGGANIAARLPAYAGATSLDVDAEWILRQDPDDVFLHAVRYTYGGTTRADPALGYDVRDTASARRCLEHYAAQPGFDNLSAVRNHHIHIIAGDFRNNAMGGLLGAVYMANILYSGLFADLDPEAVHQEYLSRFLRLDYDLDAQGVFLYPAVAVNGGAAGMPDGAE